MDLQVKKETMRVDDNKPGEEQGEVQWGSNKYKKRFLFENK